MGDYLEKYGLKKQSAKKEMLKKCYCFFKNYFGLLPVSGGMIFTGGIYSILYTFGTANHLASDPMDFLNASGYGERLASEWSKVGLPVGQFLTYTAINRFKNFFGGVVGGKKDG